MRKLLKRKSTEHVPKWNSGKNGKVLSLEANAVDSYENRQATIFVDAERSGELRPGRRRKSQKKRIFAKYLYSENCRYSFSRQYF
jgi:hypothetical protein